jgi:hypothetical protein
VIDTSTTSGGSPTHVRLDGGSAAVDCDGRAGDIAGLGGGKKRHDLSYFRDLRPTIEAVVLPSSSVLSGAAPSVNTGPGATPLTRTPLGLNSAAQARAKDPLASALEAPPRRTKRLPGRDTNSRGGRDSIEVPRSASSARRAELGRDRACARSGRPS